MECVKGKYLHNLCGSSSTLSLDGQKVLYRPFGRGNCGGKWRGGVVDSPLGGGVRIVGRDGGVSTNNGQETGDKAGMCSHARGGTSNVAPGHQRYSDQDDNSIWSRKISEWGGGGGLILITRGLEILFIIFLFL